MKRKVILLSCGLLVLCTGFAILGRNKDDLFSPLESSIVARRQVLVKQRLFPAAKLDIVHVRDHSTQQVDAALAGKLARAGYTKVSGSRTDNIVYDRAANGHQDACEIQIAEASRFGGKGTVIMCYIPATTEDLAIARILSLGGNPVKDDAMLGPSPLKVLGE